MYLLAGSMAQWSQTFFVLLFTLQEPRLLVQALHCIEDGFGFVLQKLA